MLADAGYVTEAGMAFEKAIDLRPAEPAYHRELAAAYVRLARVPEVGERGIWFEAAQREAERAWELNPNNLLTLKSLIPTYFALAKIDPALQFRAESLLEQAINLCPTDPVLWYFKGIVLLGGGERGKAPAAFEEALRLKPDYGKAREARDALLAL